MRRKPPVAGEVVRLMLNDHPIPQGSRREFGVELYASFIVQQVGEPPFANVCRVSEIGCDGVLLPEIDIYWPDWCEEYEPEVNDEEANESGSEAVPGQCAGGVPGDGEGVQGVEGGG